MDPRYGATIFTTGMQTRNATRGAFWTSDSKPSRTTVRHLTQVVQHLAGSPAGPGNPSMDRTFPCRASWAECCWNFASSSTRERLVPNLNSSGAAKSARVAALEATRNLEYTAAVVEPAYAVQLISILVIE